MTADDAARARAADFLKSLWPLNLTDTGEAFGHDVNLALAFAAQVAQRENEACAAFIEGLAFGSDPDGMRWEIPGHDCAWGCANKHHLATAIRARCQE